MATKPKIVTLTNSSVDILNVIRNNATINYKNYVPVATADAESIREIGAIIMDSPQLQNEFLSALVNRIGRVLVTSKMYDNPWSMFKKGTLEFGETIEEIFVNIAKPFQFDPNVAETNLFKREIPDVRSAFHIMNYQKYYKTTIQNDQLRQAFLSWQGITDLIAKIVDSMYTGANYDEFQTMKYMLAKHILNGRMYPVTIPAVTEANMKSIVSTIKGVSNNYEFMSNKYNVAGVQNFSKKKDQYLLINSNFDATMDVEVLASAFNMDKAEFTGKRVAKVDMTLEDLLTLFEEAKTAGNMLKEVDRENIRMVDEYLKDMEITFGNRIMNQMDDFVPVYVACGGTKNEAIDYLLTHKILRKLDERYEPYLIAKLTELEKGLNEIYGDGVFEQSIKKIHKLKERISG